MWKETIDQVISVIEIAFVNALKYYEGCKEGNVVKAVEDVNTISMNAQNDLFKKMKEENLSDDEQHEYMDYYAEKLGGFLDKYFGDNGIIKQNKGE